MMKLKNNSTPIKIPHFEGNLLIRAVCKFYKLETLGDKNSDHPIRKLPES